MHFRGQFLAQTLTVALVLAVARRTLRTYSPVRVLRSTLRTKLPNVAARIPLRWTFVVFAVHELFDTFELKSGNLQVFGDIQAERALLLKVPLYCAIRGRRSKNIEQVKQNEDGDRDSQDPQKDRSHAVAPHFIRWRRWNNASSCNPVPWRRWPGSLRA